MGGGVSLESITVNTQSHGDKKLIIKTSDETIKVPMFEQINSIRLHEFEHLKEYEVPFCLKGPYNSELECATLFPDGLDNFTITLGQSCKSLIFRPGSVLLGDNEWLDGKTFDGNMCKLVYRGPPITSEKLVNCCTASDTENCHETLTNDFKTSHCDSTMLTFCESNPDNEQCMQWLEKTTEKRQDIAIKLYSKLCSLNHNKQYCSYMCMLSRKYFTYSKYCDMALESWCNKNKTNKLCACALSNINDDDVLGPKECWLAECTLSYTDQKWLYTDQIKIKKKCKTLSCIINVDSITSNGPSTISITNNCGGGINASKSNTSSSGDDMPIEQTMGSLFSPVIFILLLFLVAIIIIYTYKYRFVKYI